MEIDSHNPNNEYAWVWEPHMSLDNGIPE